MNDLEIKKAEDSRLFWEIDLKESFFKFHNIRILEKIN